MKKSLLIGGTLATVGVAGIVGLGSASAATTTSGTSLVDKIATTFNLSKDDVQKVFDADRAEHQAERTQAMQDRLAQAVKDGKLTQAQADAITAKHAEMQTFMDSLKDKTAEERRTAMDAKRDELQQWAEDNDIPQQYLKFGRGDGPRGGFGGPGGFRGESDSTTSNN